MQLLHKCSELFSTEVPRLGLWAVKPLGLTPWFGCARSRLVPATYTSPTAGDTRTPLSPLNRWGSSTGGGGEVGKARMREARSGAPAFYLLRAGHPCNSSAHHHEPTPCTAGGCRHFPACSPERRASEKRRRCSRPAFHCRRLARVRDAASEPRLRCVAAPKLAPLAALNFPQGQGGPLFCRPPQPSRFHWFLFIF